MESGLDMLGAEESPPPSEEAPAEEKKAFDWQGLLKTAGDAGLAIYQAHQAKQAEQKQQKGAGASQLSSAISADAFAAKTLADAFSSQAMVRSAPKGKQRVAAAQRYQSAKNSADAAVRALAQYSTVLTAGEISQRVAAAETALNAAKTKAAQSPKSVAAAAEAKAWEQVLATCKSAQAAPDQKTDQAAEEQDKQANFLDRKMGPFTVKQWGIGGGALLVAGLVARKMLVK